MFRYLTAGESHGPGLVAVIEGLPAGIRFDRTELEQELVRRRGGYGRGNRANIEKDQLEVLGGIRHGYTLGSPVAVLIRNTEWPRWSEEMSPEAGTPRRRLTTPRPGHADLAGMLKYNTKDARNILERASARETAARTVVGFLARQLLQSLEILLLSQVVQIGTVRTERTEAPAWSDRNKIERSPVRTLDSAAELKMIQAIDEAHEARDTLGGVVEVVVYGLLAGIGSHVHADRRLDARLAGALMSIQAIKGVEFGEGFGSAARPGSLAHDEIFYHTTGFGRRSQRSGGVEGGMTNGELLRVRAAMKPLSTLMRALESVDVDTKQTEKAFRERSDVCAVPAAGVVAEQMVAIVLAQEIQRQLGGDTLADMQSRWQSYRQRLEDF